MKNFKYRYTSETNTPIGKDLIRNTELVYYVRALENRNPWLSKDEAIQIFLYEIEKRLRELIK